jgi:hypothetical protein
MVTKPISAEGRNPTPVGFVSEELGLWIKCCEVALASGSVATWDSKIKNAQRAHDMALRFVHHFRLSGPDARRIDQRISHLGTLLEELK